MSKHFGLGILAAFSVVTMANLSPAFAEEPTQPAKPTIDCNDQLAGISDEEKALGKYILENLFLYSTGKSEISKIDEMNKKLNEYYKFDMGALGDLFSDVTVKEMKKLADTQSDAAKVFNEQATTLRKFQKMEPTSMSKADQFKGKYIESWLTKIPVLGEMYTKSKNDGLTADQIVEGLKASLQAMVNRGQAVIEAIPQIVDEETAKADGIHRMTRVMNYVKEEYRQQMSQIQLDDNGRAVLNGALQLMTDQIIMNQDAEGHKRTSILMLQKLHMETQSALIFAGGKGIQSILQVQTNMGIMAANGYTKRINEFVIEMSNKSDEMRSLAIRSSEEVQKSNLQVQESMQRSALRLKEDAKKIAALVDGTKNGNYISLQKKEETVKVLSETLDIQSDTSKLIENAKKAQNGIQELKAGDTDKPVGQIEQ